MKTESFTVQGWDGESKVWERAGTLDGGRWIARVMAKRGQTVRLMSDSRDYCEVFSPDGSIRTGTFAETTLVKS